jgi:transketolase
MRAAFVAALTDLFADRTFTFLTGDLGFMALEPLRTLMGPRFVNAGVSEQNMVSVAAGAASVGEQCWVYSIAPFVYARPFEQIRNDVCMHDSNVKLVGNGGGYAYGVMGATHHALEDYGTLLTLPNLRAYVPAFADDLRQIVRNVSEHSHPAYLRLGRCEKPGWLTLGGYAPWRRLLPGQAGVMVVVGPIVGGLIERASEMDVASRPDIWVASELPLNAAPIPADLLDRIRSKGVLYVVEEHVRQGSLGQMLALQLSADAIHLKTFRHFCAQGYPSGRYGSQTYHRKENGISADKVLEQLSERACS